MIDTLHQYRPLFFGQTVKIAVVERAVSELPFSIFLRYQTGFRIVAASQRNQLIAREQTVEARQCITYQQRFFLPILLQKSLRRDAA